MKKKKTIKRTFKKRSEDITQVVVLLKLYISLLQYVTNPTSLLFKNMRLENFFCE